jgi:hypothetical protein
MAKQHSTPPAAVARATSASLATDLATATGQGTEALGREDVRLPRLALAQAMSPQVKRGDVKFIDGLREGDLYNDLSGEVYGEGPLEVVIVTCLGARGVLFAPLEEGGGILEANVALEDPRMQFTTSESGERRKPQATKFYDYLVWLTTTQELLALSMKGTQLKVAVNLNSLIKLPLKLDGNIVMQPPCWARTFAVGTAMQKKDAYSWANFTVRFKSVTPPDVRGLCADLHANFTTKNVVIEREREPGADDM